MNGRNGGRKIGRTGPRIGLPLEPDRSSGAASGSLRPESAALHARHPGPGYRDYDGNPLAPPPPLPSESESRWRKPDSHRMSLSNLFQHMDPQPQGYRSDAYEDAPNISHAAPPPVQRRQQALSIGATGAMIVGGFVSFMLVFFAGFLAAVLIFGEPNDGGELAIRPTPVPQKAEPELKTDLGAVNVPVPARPQIRSDGIVASASAGREILPAPSPEIANAEAARDEALQPLGTVAPSQSASSLVSEPLPAPAQVPESAIEPPVVQTPPVEQVPSVSQQIIFPPAKPAPPEMSQAQGTVKFALAEPGGNYSLQFGAFRDRDNAVALVREIAVAANAKVEAETGVSGNVLYYVRAGAFDTRADALLAVRQLRQSTGIVTFVHSNRNTG